jgi:hypothetical protein
MKKNVFLMGILSVALVFSMALFVGCDSGDGGGGSSTPAFDGASLAGTTWVNEKVEDLSKLVGETASVKGTAKLNFTSDTAGTYTAALSDWVGNWDNDSKAFLTAMVTGDNGAFTSTYAATSKTGTYTRKSGTLPFTVDVSAKTLTTTEVDGGETETVVYKLQ